MTEPPSLRFTEPIEVLDVPATHRITNFAMAAHLIRHDVRHKIVVKPEVTRRLKRTRLRIVDWFWTWPWEPWTWLRRGRRFPFWIAEHYAATFRYPPDGHVQHPDDCVIVGDVIYVGERVYAQAMDPIVRQVERYEAEVGKGFRPDDVMARFR